MNVIHNVVQNNWCVGCGMCAALCPKKRLEMCWNEQGGYSPFEVVDAPVCGENCSLCYQVCPAHGETKNETELSTALYGNVKDIKYLEATGFYLSAYVGYAEEQRLNRASGGIATWLLELLIKSKKVDAVIAVGSTDDSNKLFNFKICRNVIDIRSCSRSAYYPVEISDAIEHVLKNDGNYAIIALPCVCKAIRLAQDKIPKLKNRLKFLLGLTCGRQCSKYFAEYICAMGGGNPYRLEQINFRSKDLTKKSSNLLTEFSFTSDGGVLEKGKVLWMDMGIGTIFNLGYFQPNGCFFCDDVFAECADVSLMDAWLPEYIKDSRGTSLIITRSDGIDSLLKKGIGANLNQIDIHQVVSSQQNVLAKKRVRCNTLQDSPRLRSCLLQPAPFWQHRINQLKRKLAFSTNNNWSTIKDIDALNKICRNHLFQIKLYNKIGKIFNLPERILSKFRSKLS